MKNTKHTPGPWDTVVRSTDKGIYGYIGANGNTQTLATVECPNLEGEANARLIAAAPEMLEALEALVRGPNIAIGSPDDSAIDTLRLAERALAKARGES